MTTLDPRRQATPMTLEEEEAELARPVVCIMPETTFSPGRSVLRFADGRAQKVLRAVRKLLRADRFSKGAVCMLGAQLRSGKLRYEHDLARRRAESVKAAPCGDKTRAEMIMRRLYKVETADRTSERWLHREANHLLELFYPEIPVGDGEPRVRRFQQEYGLVVDGLPARDTFDVLLEEYASIVSTVGWVIPGRIYTALSASGLLPGSVEIWVWPSWPPPDGGRTAWVTRDPIVMHTADTPDPPAPAPAPAAEASDAASDDAASDDAASDDAASDDAASDDAASDGVPAGETAPSDAAEAPAAS